jgi:antitoxin (DNA-binding transcriptional repressor) of toxin-antitoxin stability system
VGHLAPFLAPDRRFVAESATVVHMPRAVSIRELRNSTSAVVSELEAGERLTLTVNRRPVADILPHVEDRDPWVPASELRRIMTEAPADARLLDDLADVLGAALYD